MNEMSRISKISNSIMIAVESFSISNDLDNFIFGAMIKKPLGRSIVGINAVIFR